LYLQAKLAHKAGDSDTKMRFVYEHGAIIDLGRKVNMSENGEKYLIFTRDNDGNWEFLVDVVRWDDLPEYMRKGAAKAEWVIIGTCEIEEATLYDGFNEAAKELRRLFEKTGCEVWHFTKKWMFDTKKSREALLAIFYDGGEGFEVVDMWEQMTKEQRLLRAILLDDHGPNDEDPCEWHGDGTRAEDEDWEDE
jgi:hypothetical protein